MLISFSEFQVEIYLNLFKFELLKLEKRLEIVDGLIKVVDLIDDVINVIRKSKNKKEARENIMKEFSFSENQAEAIVTLRLYRLTSTDINDLITEKKLLNESIKHFKKGIEDRSYLNKNIILELEEISKKYGTPRKSIIEEKTEDIKIDEKDLIQEEEVWVSVTHQGYIKKISQRSKDSSEESTFGKREDDIIISIKLTSNLKNLVLFSSQGQYFSIPIFKLADSKYKDIGEHVSKFTSLDALDRIISTAIVEDFQKDGDLIFSTKNGMIKRSSLKEMHITHTKRGSKFMNIKKGDEVASVSLLTDKDSFLTTITKNGYSIRYIADNISTTGLSAAGVKNITLSEGDKVVATIVNKINDVDSGKAQLIFVTHNGKAKRIKVRNTKAISRTSRGRLIAPQMKNNPYIIINAFNVELTDTIYILTDGNENINLNPKSDLLLTDTSSGLNKLTKSGINLSFNDLMLNIDGLEKFDEEKEQNKKEEAIQLDLETILDDF